MNGVSNGNEKVEYRRLMIGNVIARKSFAKNIPNPKQTYMMPCNR